MSKNVSKKRNIFKSVNKRLFGLLLFSVFIFFVSQIYFTSKVGTKGAEIETIRIEKNSIRLENEILISKINEQISTKSLKKLAKELNLVEKTVNDLKAPAKNDVAAIK